MESMPSLFFVWLIVYVTVLCFINCFMLMFIVVSSYLRSMQVALFRQSLSLYKTFWINFQWKINLIIWCHIFYAKTKPERTKKHFFRKSPSLYKTSPKNVWWKINLIISCHIFCANCSSYMLQYIFQSISS